MYNNSNNSSNNSNNNNSYSNSSNNNTNNNNNNNKNNNNNTTTTITKTERTRTDKDIEETTLSNASFITPQIKGTMSHGRSLFGMKINSNISIVIAYNCSSNDNHIYHGPTTTKATKNLKGGSFLQFQSF
ncbi:hypothetical protein ACTA71_007310 [Dictyostelium dimigraforme]